MTVLVEKRDIDTVVVHGSLAGLLAGLVLGTTTVIVSLILTGSASWPFRFAASIVAGPDAVDPAFPLGAALLLGSAIHFMLAAGFGVLYGSIFGFVTWEIDFLAVVPTLFPFLVGRIDVATQLWNGVLSYVVIYGPVLAAYVIVIRPGVIDDWRAVGPPAGTFSAPGREVDD